MRTHFYHSHELSDEHKKDELTTKIFLACLIIVFSSHLINFHSPYPRFPRTKVIGVSEEFEVSDASGFATDLELGETWLL